MAVCPYGKASLVFPLSISSSAALGILATAEDLPNVQASVIGYSTPLTVEAGACSVRLKLQLEGSKLPPGNYAVALRADSDSSQGWMPGLANTKHTAEALLLEVVLLARPDRKLSQVMYLPSETISGFWPSTGSGAQVRLLEPLLLPQLSDCPGQWLRDRLLKLADMLETRFGCEVPQAAARLEEALCTAGLRLVDPSLQDSLVGPADRGARVDKQELGYWQEEMDHGHMCAGSMDGNHRLDVPDDIIAAML